MLKWLLDRLDEPSTATAIAGFIAAAGVSVEAGAIGNILLGIAAIFGLFGISMKEKK